ncbi:nucleotidyltransferase domain-containing protein [Fusibacter sp. JL298sf-3]
MITSSVKEFLEIYKNEVLSTLMGKVDGIYIHGSIVLDEFIEESSDIDIVITLSEDCTSTDLDNLLNLHLKLNEQSEWGEKLECSYIRRDLLIDRNPPLEPRIYYNRGISWEVYGYEFILEKQVLALNGITLFGEEFKSFDLMYSKDEVKEAVCKMLNNTWQPMLAKSDDLTDEYIIYGVKSMCRVIHTIETGNIYSKQAAREYVVSKATEKTINIVNYIYELAPNECLLHREDAVKFINDVILIYRVNC